MRTSKEARRDAHEFARAEMYYGEGAGIRRRLIHATVEEKMDRDPAYRVAFHQALSKEDMAEHAAKARKERRRTDVAESTSKNVRAILTGNHKGVNTAVLVVGTAAYYAHQYGLDVKIYETGKRQYQRARTWIEIKRIDLRIRKLNKN